MLENIEITHRKGFPGGSASKESACNAGDLASIPELGRFPGEGKGYLLQYSGLENSMDYISPWGRKELAMTERLSHSLTAIKVMCIWSLSLKISYCKI